MSSRDACAISFSSRRRARYSRRNESSAAQASWLGWHALRSRRAMIGQRASLLRSAPVNI